jgi:hypothetical protein
MTSIQDIANAAFRIRDSADGVQLRTLMCADSLQKQATQLRGLVRGSRTGEDAVQQVTTAERALRECSAQLLTLQSNIDRFVRDLTK